MNVPSVIKCLIVGVVGRTNAGKSTLVNRFVGEKVSIVSPVTQTTRHTIRGILTEPRGQIVFADTPGLHRAEGHLGTLLNRMARQTAANVDVLLVVFDASMPPHIEDDGWMRRALFMTQPVLFALNKSDASVSHAAAFRKLWDDIQAEKGERRAVDCFAVSAVTGAGIKELGDALFALAKPSEALLFDADTVTDHPRRLAIADAVREQLNGRLREEMPHEIGVLVDAIDEQGDVWQISATVFVNRASQKAIVIGPKGRLLRAVKRAVVPEISAMFGVKVNLELWVKVEPGWSRNIWRLRQMGYMGGM